MPSFHRRTARAGVPVLGAALLVALASCAGPSAPTPPAPTPAARKTSAQHSSIASQLSGVSSQRKGAPRVPLVW